MLCTILTSSLYMLPNLKDNDMLSFQNFAFSYKDDVTSRSIYITARFLVQSGMHFRDESQKLLIRRISTGLQSQAAVNPTV